MGFTRESWRIALAIASFMFAIVPSPCRADCEHTAYAYEDRVITFGCNAAGAAELHVIQLDDASPLKVASSLMAPSARAFDTASHFRNFVMLLRWNKFEVYDLGDASHPKMVATFDLNKRGSFTGYERIEQTAANKFLVLTSLGAVEVTTEGEPAKWVVAEIPTDKELQRKMSERPPEWRFSDQNERSVVVRETARFRYELNWREKTSAGEVLHRQYLLKVDLATQRTSSELLLGERLETID